MIVYKEITNDCKQRKKQMIAKKERKKHCKKKKKKISVKNELNISK